MLRTAAWTALLMLIGAGPASAYTLRAHQVLVVYDSRVPASRAVAEHYAGSHKVPGGAGGEPGVHEDLLVFDLASAGLPVTATNGTILYPDYKAQIRDPIRAHLIAEDLVYRVRCLVLCKGLPHRVDDPANPGAGDTASAFGTLFTSGQAKAASVDSELTMLWQDLDEIPVDLFLRTAEKGYIRNPMWRQSRPINTWTNKAIRDPKAWSWIVGGRLLTTTGPDPSAQLTPGDMLLVCRLDGHTVADVRAMIERAQGLIYDADTAAFILDESASNAIADTVRNSELDNIEDPLTDLDDYETARDLLLADGRFNPSRIHYNAASGVANFIVGPNVDFEGQGLLVSDPVILLTHFGRNHVGRPTVNPQRYEESFNLAPGAVFNTMESYNGRAFNGLGTLAQQGQLADFIASGGAFGIGMVYEPFAQSVPDSNRLVRNFFLGRLTWAEAAYAAIPCISWMHVVVGDPLASAIRSAEDINGDGVLDVEDLIAWERNPVDLNRDGVADDADRRLLTDTVRSVIDTVHDAGRR